MRKIVGNVAGILVASSVIIVGARDANATELTVSGTACYPVDGNVPDAGLHAIQGGFSGHNGMYGPTAIEFAQWGIANVSQYDTNYILCPLSYNSTSNGISVVGIQGWNETSPALECQAFVTDGFGDTVWTSFETNPSGSPFTIQWSVGTPGGQTGFILCTLPPISSSASWISSYWIL
jgi:hypothetical protein